jgi:hypothetical protein
MSVSVETLTDGERGRINPRVSTHDADPAAYVLPNYAKMVGRQGLEPWTR